MKNNILSIVLHIIHQNVQLNNTEYALASIIIPEMDGWMEEWAVVVARGGGRVMIGGNQGYH